MGNTGQDEEQGELAELLLAEGAGDAEIGGYLFERMEESEGGTAGGRGNEGMVEFAAEETAESADTGFGPGGEVEESAVSDFAVLAEGFAQEDGRGLC